MIVSMKSLFVLGHCLKHEGGRTEWSAEADFSDDIVRQIPVQWSALSLSRYTETILRPVSKIKGTKSTCEARIDLLYPCMNLLVEQRLHFFHITETVL